MAAVVAGFTFAVYAGPAAAQGVAIDRDDIGGVVTGPGGPEAGVWVIAETRDLGTRYIKAVVTDDRGRYVLPDLPSAEYNVWVRGFGESGDLEIEVSFVARLPLHLRRQHLPHRPHSRHVVICPGEQHGASRRTAGKHMEVGKT